LGVSKPTVAVLAFPDITSTSAKKGNLEPKKLVTLGEQYEADLHSYSQANGLKSGLQMFWNKSDSSKTYLFPDDDANSIWVTMPIDADFAPTDFSSTIFFGRAALSRSSSPICTLNMKGSIQKLLGSEPDQTLLVTALQKNTEWAVLSDVGRLCQLLSSKQDPSSLLTLMDLAKLDGDMTERAIQGKNLKNPSDNSAAVTKRPKTKPTLPTVKKGVKNDDLILTTVKLAQNVASGITRVSVRRAHNMTSIAFVSGSRFTELRYSDLTGETTQFSSIFFDEAAKSCVAQGKTSMLTSSMVTPEMILYETTVNFLFFDFAKLVSQRNSARHPLCLESYFPLLMEKMTTAFEKFTTGNTMLLFVSQIGLRSYWFSNLAVSTFSQMKEMIVEKKGKSSIAI